MLITFPAALVGLFLLVIIKAFHASPVDRATHVTGTNFALGSHEKLQHGFRDEKRPKKGKQNIFNNFRAYHSIGNTQGYIIAVKWKAYVVENTRAMQDNTIRTARIHPAFIPVTAG